MSGEEWVLVNLIAFLAFSVRGMVGFGSTLVMTPLLVLFIDLKTAVVLSAIANAASGLGLVMHARREVIRRTFLILTVSSLAGLTLGTYLLVTQPSGLLKRLVGLLTFLFAVRFFQGERDPARPAHPWPESAGIPAGLISGVLGGLFGTSGPPLVIFLARRGVCMAAFRAILVACFTVMDVSRLFGYAAAGLVPRTTLLAGVLMIPATLLGSYVGTVIHLRSSERVLRIAVGAVLLITGALLALGH